ncbi:MAG: hypothetical protein QOD92_3662 [Acidimicrobiaceae bacterium]|jgi:hypothetical protein
MMRLLPLAVFAIAVAALGVSRLQEPGDKGVPRATRVAVQAPGSTIAAPADATELQPVPSSDGGAFEPDGAVTLSATPAGGQQSPNGPPLQGRASETSLPRDSAMAGPPVSYTDPADDADGVAAQPTLSQPAFDILEVRWAPASEVDTQQRGYSSSITVAGAARNDAAYVTYGTSHQMSRASGVSCTTSSHRASLRSPTCSVGRPTMERGGSSEA